MAVISAARTDAQLRDAHAMERLGPYLREMWDRRAYIWYVSVSELRSRRVNTVLGNLWHVLSPILTVAVYFLIFGLLLDVTRGVDNLIVFLSIGIFLFRTTQGATNAGATCVTKNANLIRSIRFPRAVLPITTTLTTFLGSLSSFVVIFAVALLTGEPLRWQWLIMVPIVALQTLFNAGAAMVAARATTHFPDTTQFLPFLFRLLLLGSGVIFNVTAYAEGNAWVEALFTLNPIYCFITTARWTVLGGDDVTTWVVVSMTAWTFALLVGGFLWFRGGEQEYARD